MVAIDIKEKREGGCSNKILGTADIWIYTSQGASHLEPLSFDATPVWKKRDKVLINVSCKNAVGKRPASAAHGYVFWGQQDMRREDFFVYLSPRGNDAQISLEYDTRLGPYRLDTGPYWNYLSRKRGNNSDLDYVGLIGTNGWVVGCLDPSDPEQGYFRGLFESHRASGIE